MKKCPKCKQNLPLDSFGKHANTVDKLQRQCKNCYSKYKQTHRQQINKTNVEWSHRVGRRRPYQTLKDKSLYLGVCVAENLLASVFKNVIKMPMTNPGFDFICGKGFKVDVKSSCLRNHPKCWWFGIKKNIAADYFACIAFDNRTSITPLYFWLIPGHIVNSKMVVSISEATLKKWDIYRQPISRILVERESQKLKGVG